VKATRARHARTSRSARPGGARPEKASLDASILVVDDEVALRKVVGRALSAAGCTVTYAADGEEALALLTGTPPDLVISDVTMPRVDGFELLRRIRAQATTKALPVILLTGRGDTEDIVAGMGLGADDYLVKPFALRELLARVRAKIERPPAPAARVVPEAEPGVLSAAQFGVELGREVARAQKTNRRGSVALISLHELQRLRTRFSSRVEAEIERQTAAVIMQSAEPLDVLGRDAQGRFTLLLPETDASEAQRRLIEVMEAIGAHEFRAGGEVFQLTPVAGFLEFGVQSDAAELEERCSIALEHGELQLDLRPVLYTPTMRPLARPARPATGPGVMRLLVTVPAQIVITQLLAIAVPLAVYLLLDTFGIDIVPIAYVVVVIALLATAILIWTEGLLALRPMHPPRISEDRYVPATAIIVAYLPNEAPTIVETIRSFQRIDYPAGLQIVLAYNTPKTMPVEETVAEMARADPRLKVVRVEGSESKAQNVNAALSDATGEFIGIFDADHHPEPNGFRRAWRWLDSGYDVVQGHCAVRNGDETWVSRIVAVEFEAIYAVSHPGRARLHGFGIFGGSNGYWKAHLLHEIRMHAFMLTEDIDSSIRALLEGRRIASDPFLVSRELAPVTLHALWNQRMRWAQGWFQVSYRYMFEGLASRRLSLRQKLGLVQLLSWREVYPWIANQMVPIIIFWTIKFGGLSRIDWLVPVFVMTTIFTLGTGPAQTLLAWRLANHDIRRHAGWFFYYLLMSSLFYTAFKNLIAVVAQVNEALQQRRWMVTPRAARIAATEAEIRA
jgi:DNA-binding response OmpR family regulator/cellulose synthase/poly-beta-1,6-N-acetylglucosamine synthase-like glycosyltransferase